MDKSFQLNSLKCIPVCLLLLISGCTELDGGFTDDSRLSDGHSTCPAGSVGDYHGGCWSTQGGACFFRDSEGRCFTTCVSSGTLVDPYGVDGRPDKYISYDSSSGCDPDEAGCNEIDLKTHNALVGRKVGGDARTSEEIVFVSDIGYVSCEDERFKWEIQPDEGMCLVMGNEGECDIHSCKDLLGIASISMSKQEYPTIPTPYSSCDEFFRNNPASEEHINCIQSRPSIEITNASYAEDQGGGESMRVEDFQSLVGFENCEAALTWVRSNGGPLNENDINEAKASFESSGFDENTNDEVVHTEADNPEPPEFEGDDFVVDVWIDNLEDTSNCQLNTVPMLLQRQLYIKDDGENIWLSIHNNNPNAENDPLLEILPDYFLNHRAIPLLPLSNDQNISFARYTDTYGYFEYWLEGKVGMDANFELSMTFTVPTMACDDFTIRVESVNE